MSTTDKTRQQLVDSMRKTKAGAAGKKTVARSKATRPAGRTTKTTKKAAATTVGKQPAKEAGSRPKTRDSYCAGQRVWPD